MSTIKAHKILIANKFNPANLVHKFQQISIALKSIDLFCAVFGAGIKIKYKLLSLRYIRHIIMSLKLYYFYRKQDFFLRGEFKHFSKTIHRNDQVQNLNNRIYKNNDIS